MTHTIEICEAIKNGIEYLQEEAMFGKGSPAYLASLYLRIAARRGNVQAAAYWSEVAATCHKLEQITPRTQIIITARAH